uniref:Uncharacterized protein n=1 Tax=Romanomermis culicivorax TaxID=13658 RepID=A0A915K0C7_ROMCU
MLTVSPNKQYFGNVTPTTPAATEPLFRPIRKIDNRKLNKLRATAPIRAAGFSAQQNSRSVRNFMSKQAT